MMLYKYMPLNVARLILQTGRIGFSRPGFFNDPFDTPVAQPLPTANRAEALFAKVAAMGKSHIWELRSGVLCLTRTATNSLMWAHYADSHKGVVMAIDAAAAGFLDPASNMVPAHFGNVVYTRRRPVGNYQSPFGETVVVGETHRFVLSHYEKWQRLFLTKPLDWAYEEEVRVVKCLNGLGSEGGATESGDFKIVQVGDRPLHCYTLPPNAITGLAVGARVTKDSKTELEELAGDRPVFRAKLDDATFSVRIPGLEAPES